MPDRNFLLGYGERLTERVTPGGRVVTKRMPYGFGEAVARLTPMLEETAQVLQMLPAHACPRDEAVAILRLHPEFLAKSYYPDRLLRELGLETVGSRPATVQPQKWTKKAAPDVSPTTDLFVAGPRRNFRRWATSVSDWNEETPGAEELVRLEDLHAPVPQERLRGIPEEGRELLLETALHARSSERGNFILEAFEQYARELGCDAELDRRLYAGGLCFLPVHAPREALLALAQFSFLRVARPMPALRPFGPIIRSFRGPERFACELPTEGPVNPDLRALVLDGGMPDDPGWARWVHRRDAVGVGAPVDVCVDHGAKVTSALLFGPLHDGEPPPRPYCFVENVRVLDDRSGTDDDLFDVLRRVQDTLRDGGYSFVNLSIGPALPIEDGEVHAWTAVLDEIFSGGDVLATVAVGNGGHLDDALGHNRIQVPADCVNSLGVGAADSRGDRWRRAAYSSVGPGRSPGLVKPDVVAFGGAEAEPFWVIHPTKLTESVREAGTSFASPATLRMGIGIRAHFGDVLGALAIKALLVHGADDRGGERREIGWGLIGDDLDHYVVCPDGTVRVVYQGRLGPAQYLRAPIPLPAEAISGLVTLRATFCYRTQTDPDHPGAYTRSGLDIVFRPHDQKFSPDAAHPKPVAFFQLKEFSTGDDIRRDAHKWETVLHRQKRMRGSGLHNPVFDVHYNAREAGGPSGTTDQIPYALVITVSAPAVRDLYDRVVRRYRTQLQPLLPVIEIPVRVQT